MELLSPKCESSTRKGTPGDLFTTSRSIISGRCGLSRSRWSATSRSRNFFDAISCVNRGRTHPSSLTSEVSTYPDSAKVRDGSFIDPPPIMALPLCLLICNPAFLSRCWRRTRTTTKLIKMATSSITKKTMTRVMPMLKGSGAVEAPAILLLHPAKMRPW